MYRENEKVARKSNAGKVSAEKQKYDVVKSCGGAILGRHFRGLRRGVLMSPCRSFSSPPVVYLARDKCRCPFFAAIQLSL